MTWKTIGKDEIPLGEVFEFEYFDGFMRAINFAMCYTDEQGVVCVNYSKKHETVINHPSSVDYCYTLEHFLEAFEGDHWRLLDLPPVEDVKETVVIFDIDGTLANMDHRLHFIQGEEKNWDAFFDSMVNDKPIKPMIEVLKAMHKSGFKVLFCTGRPGSHAKETIEWVNHMTGIEFEDSQFYFRPTGDHSPDDKIKEGMLREIQQKYEVLTVFEDRKRVVDMWRKNDIHCCQVAEGDF